MRHRRSAGTVSVNQHTERRAASPSQGCTNKTEHFSSITPAGSPSHLRHLPPTLPPTSHPAGCRRSVSRGADLGVTSAEINHRSDPRGRRGGTARASYAKTSSCVELRVNAFDLTFALRKKRRKKKKPLEAIEAGGRLISCVLGPVQTLDQVHLRKKKKKKKKATSERKEISRKKGKEK